MKKSVVQLVKAKKKWRLKMTDLQQIQIYEDQLLKKYDAYINFKMMNLTRRFLGYYSRLVQVVPNELHIVEVQNMIQEGISIKDACEYVGINTDYFYKHSKIRKR